MRPDNKTDSFTDNLTAAERHENGLKPYVCNYLIYDGDVNRTAILTVTAQAGRELEISYKSIHSLFQLLMQRCGQKGLTFRSPVLLLGFLPLPHPPPLPAGLQG